MSPAAGPSAAATLAYSSSKCIKLTNIPAAERAACRHEVKLMQRLSHPNIVGYKDSFFAKRGSQLCIVMTYCDGGDLSERVKRQTRTGRRVKEDQILHWFVQIALGLHFMHENRVLHRDLKTQNIFLTKEGNIKLGDFGIARVLNAPVEMAMTVRADRVPRRMLESVLLDTFDFWYGYSYLFSS